jgi:hypothetical protein
MSNTTYLSNSSLVQNGDLFKIMELRYSHSIFDKNGCFNSISPISNSLELIRWYRNCEDFFTNCPLKAHLLLKMILHHFRRN